MSVYTTEITSDQIPSDNPLHQRLLKAYYEAAPLVSGDTLELGCGEGRGVGLISQQAKTYLALDKIPEVINKLSAEYPHLSFSQAVFPPMDFPDESFDTIVNFQVIEHIQDDKLFLKEIARMLRPRGRAIITTPNNKMTLSRNPWHTREYTGDQLKDLAAKYFSKVEMKGIAGNERVIEYHEKNRASVQKIMKWDILNLQYRLPGWLLTAPYEYLNRKNRHGLKDGNDDLVMSIDQMDYFLRDQHEENLDLFTILTK